MTKDLQAIRAINELHDDLVSEGVSIPDAYKRRDPIEPGREQKELAELKLEKLVTRLFKEQEKLIREWMELQFVGRKQIISGPTNPPNDLLDDPDFIATVIALVILFANQGIEITNVEAGNIIDTIAIQGVIIDWATVFTTEWMKTLNTTTLKALQSALELFASTPGMTIGDVIDLLPFDATRAKMVAITEVTNLYGQAAQLAGEQLARDFPGVRVIKTWWTNNDAIVRECPVCWPLHGVSVKIKSKFTDGAGNKQVAPAAHPRGRCWISVRTDISKSVELQ